MMHEVLFRGKRIDNGKWIVGHLLRYENGRARIIESHTDIFCYENDENTIVALAYEVDPETVGQFTGLVGKNGKKVFEDDVVVICYETDGEDFSETKRVHYNEQECCWYPMRWNECCEYCDHYTEVKSIEVIGNIYDKPDLLRGGDVSE